MWPSPAHSERGVVSSQKQCQTCTGLKHDDLHSNSSLHESQKLLDWFCFLYFFTSNTYRYCTCMHHLPLGDLILVSRGCRSRARIHWAGVHRHCGRIMRKCKLFVGYIDGWVQCHLHASMRIDKAVSKAEMRITIHTVYSRTSITGHAPWSQTLAGYNWIYRIIEWINHALIHPLKNCHVGFEVPDNRGPVLL